MEWKFEHYHSKYERLGKWHPWFAWYPVEVGEINSNHWVWLEKIERKSEFHQGYRMNRYRKVASNGG